MPLNAMPLLVDIRDSDSQLGMDIGGTLAKMVIAMPCQDEDPIDGTNNENAAHLQASRERLKRLPSYFGESGRCPPELSFKASINNKTWILQFLRGSTQRLVPLLSTGAAGLNDIPIELRGPPRQVVAAGGGAHKFKDLFLSSMWIELIALKEFQSLVDGLRFLHAHQPPQELYTVTQDKNDINIWKETVIDNWPVPLYPFLLVSFGSGVSILQVNSGAESDYERVGGTATGGATFLGLMNLLSKNYRKEPLSFDEAVELAASGDPRKVDKLVGDIYGEDGCANLGLPPYMTAANFGKLASVLEHRQRFNRQHNGDNVDGDLNKVEEDEEDDEGDSDETLPNPSLADIAAATLQMISQASAVLVRTIAQQAKCLTRVFVVGGFMDSNPIARKVFGQNLAALKGRAIFVKHSGFLGSLGSLQNCLSSGLAMSRHMDPMFYGWDLGILPTSRMVGSEDYTNQMVREITCPTDLVKRKQSSTDVQTTASVDRSPPTQPVPMTNKIVIEEKLSVCSSGVAYDSVDSKVLEFPLSLNINTADGSSPLNSGSQAGKNERAIITDTKLSDANYWWQFGMMWAFAASFAMVRDDEQVYALLKEKNLFPLSEEDESSYDHDIDPSGNDSDIGSTGRISGSDWRFSESIRCLDKCIQLEPRCAIAFWALSWVHGHSKTLPVQKTNTSTTVGGSVSGGNNQALNTEEGEGSSDEECAHPVLSFESAHFASRRAVGLLRTGSFTDKEEALIETNGLRFALWPPCEYARYLSLTYAAAMKCALDRFPTDPDIVTIKVRSRLDVLDSKAVFSDYEEWSNSPGLNDHSDRERKLLGKVDIALRSNSNHIGLLLAAYTLLTRLLLKDKDDQELLVKLKETISSIVKTSPDSASLYLSPSKSWKRHGFYKSMFGLKSPTHSGSGSSGSSPKAQNKNPHTVGGSFGGNAAMGRMRGISYGVITDT